MPKIRCTTVMIEGRPLRLASVLRAAAQPPDDLPVVDSVDAAVEIVRRHDARRFACFRFSDDPSITVVWYPLGTAAVVFTVHNRRHVANATAVLLGTGRDDDQRALRAAQWFLALTESEISVIAAEKRPTVALFNRSPEPPAGWADVLSLVLYSPVMCRMCGVV